MTGRAAAVALVALAALVVPLLPEAGAHASLIAIEPPIDRTPNLNHSPGRFFLTFTEHLDPATSSIAVYNTTADPPRQVDLGSPVITADPPTMTVRVPDDLPAGTYIVRYTAISTEDGHPNTQFVGFAIGDHAAPASSAGVRVDGAAALSKALLYSGFSLVFAAAAFLLWVPGTPRDLASRALVVGATLHLVGTVFLFKAAFDASEVARFSAYLASGDGPGRIYMLRTILGAGAWVVAILGHLRPTRSAPVAVTAILLLAAAGSTRLGHGYAYGYGTAALDFVHLVAASVWVGGLLLFVFLLRSGPDPPAGDLRARGIRFGTIAMTSVLAIVSTGIVLALSIVGLRAWQDPVATLSQPYAIFLAGKVALALVMVVLAGVNRYVMLEAPATQGLAGRLQRAVGRATWGKVRPGLADGSRLGRTVAIEASLGVAILVLAGFLTSVPPPAVAEPVQSLELEAQDAQFKVGLHIEPAPQLNGRSRIELDIQRILSDGSVAPMHEDTCGRTACVTLTIAYPSGTEGARTAVLGPAGWTVDGVLWTQAGPANLTLRISAPAVQDEPPVFEDTLVVAVDVAR